jgi:hypothetical protein
VFVVADDNLPSAYPSPRPLGIGLDGADVPTNTRAERIYSAAEHVDTSSPTGRLADLISSTDSSIALLSLASAMMAPVGSRSLRILESASASGLLRRLCFPRVSSPMAKYASCWRAHGPQKGTPRISTSALRGQGLSVLLRTWQGPGFVIASVKETPCPKGPRPLL